MRINRVKLVIEHDGDGPPLELDFGGEKLALHGASYSENRKIERILYRGNEVGQLVGPTDFHLHVSYTTKPTPEELEARKKAEEEAKARNRAFNEEQRKQREADGEEEDDDYNSDWSDDCD